ncbi:Gfo/Idh/MocA family protein [Branchiibius cervicis]|uniref:Gfo/Idh/MocA family protein n=1 Tax=Branchiibius cervicis TaxID=908252 RepID=A0ABW2AWB4_9MICO
MAVLPTTRIPDPMSAAPLRWGFSAPGGIAATMAATMHANSRQRVVAVASRSQDRADAFAGEFGVERAYDDLAAMCADPTVDAVYVASPHSGHLDQALVAVEAGKHVLVEKAFTVDAAQARRLVEAARRNGVTCMEAMWTRFLPGTDVVRQLLADGALGDLEAVYADHGQWFAYDPQHRLFNPDLAGGALLDLGIYPVSFAAFVLGTDLHLRASGRPAPTGVDGHVSIVATRDDATAVLDTTLFARTPTTASISGTQARLEFAADFYTPTPVTLIGRDGDSETIDPGPLRRHEGLVYEAAHFAQLVADDRRESPLLPLAETVAIMDLLDEIRRQL